MRNEGRSGANSWVDLHLDDSPMPNSVPEHDHDHDYGHDFLLIVLLGFCIGSWVMDGCTHADVRKRLDALEKRIPVPAEATKP